MFSINDSTAQAQERTWEPVPPGEYEVVIQEAGWTTARTGAGQFMYKGKVAGPNGSLTFSEWLVHTKASGEPNGYGRERIAAMARSCRAVTSQGEPDPKAMAGKSVRLVLGVEEDGRGVPRNRLVKVVEPKLDEDGQPVGQRQFKPGSGGSADAYREASQGSARQGPPADFDDGVPF